jgi:hypothetical protein
LSVSRKRIGKVVVACEKEDSGDRTGLDETDQYSTLQSILVT